MITATRLEAAAAAVTVLSNRLEVTDWALRYFGPWWNATTVDAAVCSGAVVIADVKPEDYEEITLLVHDGRPTKKSTLGWDHKAREHLRSGGSFHPTQHESVTEALLAGDHTPLWENAKRERKVQVFPDQFPDLFGVPLATRGWATGLLFPQVDADAAPDIADGTRTLGEADFMSGATEDRYPDVFGQARGVDGGGRESARAEVAARLAELPHRAVQLSHDVRASAAVLTKVADTL
ncbi:hypothetical protein STHAL_06650 [Streptomyces halstedii]|uniref:Uncharacterized protein n=1 Tax=Streptomyces halstedii TaxID=1944 RepID=A0ABS6TLQ3_STRHA|nr:hypothetical protein [Streptomyces halstedii]MBV7669170.1 hypothetical protein [Streptomyces halstedii]